MIYFCTNDTSWEMFKSVLRPSLKAGRALSPHCRIQWDKRFFSQAASCSEAGICFVVLCVYGKSSSWHCGVLHSVVQYTELLSVSPPPPLGPPCCVCVFIYTHTSSVSIYRSVSSCHRQLRLVRGAGRRQWGVTEQGPLLGAHLSELTISAATLPGVLLLRQ